MVILYDDNELDLDGTVLIRFSDKVKGVIRASQIATGEENGLTVALDVKITEELRAEGIARELVNRIQNFRKDSGLDITDKITLKVDTNEFIKNAIIQNKSYVCNEVLANEILFEKLEENSFKTNIVEQDDVGLRLLKN